MKAMRTPTIIAIRCAVAGLVASCAAGEPGAPAAGDGTGQKVQALAARPVDPARTAALLARARDLVRPGSVVQTEPRLGVPTFLWARGNSRAQAAAVAARATAGLGARSPVDAARAALADYAPLYGLGDGDVASAVVANVHQGKTGPVIVKLRAQRGGIEIFGEELAVVMNRALEPVALSGYLTGAAAPVASGAAAFRLAPAAAAAAAASQLAQRAIDPAMVIADGERDGYQRFVLAAAAKVRLADVIRVRPVYFHAADGLAAAYYAEVEAYTGAPPAHVLSVDDRVQATEEAYAMVVSAGTGQLVFKKNLIADAVGRGGKEASALGAGGFSYRVWADPVTGIPYDTPAGNGAHPKLTATPDGAQASFVAQNDVTLPNFPFSQNDPWLAGGATETSGNNVDAYLNLFSPDGLGNPVAAPADPPTGDYRAQVTGAGQFLHTNVPDVNGALAEGRQGAIQQLFYDLNFLHDWYYDAGFDEAAGNAQTDNFGRGGLAADSLKAQVQDFAGFDNANMLTPADGARPRMRMYNFPAPANHLAITAPGAIAAKYQIGISMSGPQTFDLTTDIVRATFSNSPSACTVTNSGAISGKIAMFDFDNTDGVSCAFATRITQLAATGASAVLMIYTSAAPSSIPSITGFNATHTKPVAVLPWNTGQLIKGQLAVPATVTARLFRAADRDGALDTQIVFHEWFHYASNRLIGNGSGLDTQMAGGMGEGWSDFNAMMLTVRQDDTAVPSNANYGGAYALATFATSGVPYDGTANQGYYFGVRRYPYSTDMTKNPLTFHHITDGVALPSGPPVAFGSDGANNSEVHNTGEVWTEMLWECYAALLRDTLGASPRLTFHDAQDRMKQYLIAGLKATPRSPTFTEARDALLAVMFASDPTDYLACRVAFAKRGAGLRAVSPDRYTIDNAGVIEDFTTGPDVTLVGVTLDDTLGSCDSDGVLDHGEYGRVTVTLRNIGTVTLSAPTATITTTSPDVWYPFGHALSFAPIAPGATGSASLRIAYARGATGIDVLDLQIAYTDPAIGSVQTGAASFRTHTDEIASSSATDTVEPASSVAVTGFDASLGNVAPWTRLEVDPLHHVWHVDDPGSGADQYLVSPVMTVDAGGAFTVQFDHSWSFEFDGGGNYDGGVIEMSVNSGAYTDIGGAVGGGAYTGTIATYGGDVNPLKGRPGFVQSSAGVVHTVVTRAVAPGSTVRVRFRFGADGSGAAPGWSIDNVAYSGVNETPFPTVVPDSHTCTVVPNSADLAITVTDGATSATAGGSVMYTIVASNVSGDSILGATVADVFPSDLTCTWTCAGSAGGTCAASGSGNIADVITLPVGGAATYTASCTLSLTTLVNTLSNTATIAAPGTVSDPVLANNTATDVDSVIRPPAHLLGVKTVSGNFVTGGTVTYTLVLFNDGVGTQTDNPGNELIDVLPPALTLVSAAASSGTAVALLGTNTVTWNGALSPGNAVTITIVATIAAGAGASVSNQATFVYDSQGVGTNDATGVTDAYPCALGLVAGSGPAPLASALRSAR